ncbi:MAG: hypothetical protein JO097_19615 [Acidobacteriaceae bacterium]|nr:hypothetical protein [Acidobacteriaceae bacterium]MBV9294120.1 hypothetical protein [Acidobacteriaceae bacterium]MBV9765976.1 hypothetical protein [Acidobacteriaceae bacterium]
MRASEELAKRQREYPLSHGSDRGAALFSRLAPLDLPVLEALRISQSLVVGEVGRMLPNAKTFHYPDGSHAIMLFSGLIDFFDTVTAILFGATNLYTGKEVLKMSFTVDTVITELQALFERWKPGGISGVLDPVSSVSPLAPLVAADAATMAQAAHLFILSHELGHVFYYCPLDNDDGSASAPILTRAQEFDADATGMRNLIRMARSGGEARMRFAGVMVSLRVFAVFASLGHTFPNDHPQPIDRLHAIESSARAFCSTERDYWSLSPIGYAYEEMLEVAGLKALGSSDRPALNADRMFSRMSSVLEEAAKGSVPHSEVLDTMNPDFRDADPEVIEQVAVTAARMFPPVSRETTSSGQDALWAEKAKVYRSLIGQWPDAVNTIIQKTLGNLYPNEG